MSHAAYLDRRTFSDDPDVRPIPLPGRNGAAIGDVLDIVYRPVGRPPMSFPSCVLDGLHKYCGPVFLEKLPAVSPDAPRRAHNGARAPIRTAYDPSYPRLGRYLPQKPGAPCGPGCDAGCVFARPAKPSYEKSYPRSLFAAFPRAKSPGRGVYGDEGFAPSALYLQALCSREGVLLRVENAIPAGRAPFGG